MTNTFFDEAKTLVSLFIEETRESASWFKAEILRQYHLSILREIALTHPETTLHINKAYEIIDNVPLDCPDFVEPSEDSLFETEAETDAFKFVEMKQNISDDGLN